MVSIIVLKFRSFYSVALVFKDRRLLHISPFAATLYRVVVITFDIAHPP